MRDLAPVFLRCNSQENFRSLPNWWARSRSFWWDSHDDIGHHFSFDAVVLVTDEIISQLFLCQRTSGFHGHIHAILCPFFFYSGLYQHMRIYHVFLRIDHVFLGRVGRRLADLPTKAFKNPWARPNQAGPPGLPTMGQPRPRQKLKAGQDEAKGLWNGPVRRRTPRPRA